MDRSKCEAGPESGEEGLGCQDVALIPSVKNVMNDGDRVDAGGRHCQRLGRFWMFSCPCLGAQQCRHDGKVVLYPVNELSSQVVCYSEGCSQPILDVTLDHQLGVEPSNLLRVLGKSMRCRVGFHQ